MSKKNRDQDIEAGTTDEQKAADRKAKKAEANKRWAERRKEARPRVVQFLKDNKELIGTIYDDLALFVAAAMREPKAPKERKTAAKPSVNAELRAALLEGPMSELDIFRKFKIGRPEMKLKIRAFINGTPRIWVDFDESSETYSVVATGEAMPEGWTGYKPQAKAEL